MLVPWMVSKHIVSYQKTKTQLFFVHKGVGRFLDDLMCANVFF